MMAALEAGADDVADDGGTWRVTAEPSIDVTTSRDALEAAGFAVESADTPMVSRQPRAGHRRVEEAKKVLRIVEAIEDNDDVQDVFANFDIPDEVMEAGDGECSGVSVGRRCDRAPASRCRAPGGSDVLAGRLRRPAGRARVLPGRRHAGVHEAAQQLQRRPRRSSPTRRPGAGDLGAGHRQPRARSRPSTAFDFPLLADTDKAVAAPYGTLGPLGFPRRSVFIVDGDGVVRYAHRAIAGLTYRPVSELVGVLRRCRSAGATSATPAIRLRRRQSRTLRRLTVRTCVRRSAPRCVGARASTPG